MARRSSEQTGYLGLIRIVTVFALIMLFLAQTGAGAANSSWPIFHLYEGFTRWSVPCLIMCCGAYAVELGDRVSSSFARLIVPCFLALVLWSVLYGLVSTLLSGGGLTLASFWSRLWSAALGDTLSHLWILYILLGLYLVTPILGRFAQSASRWELVYFFVLAFLFAGMLPLWNALAPNHFSALLDRLQVHVVLGWAGCYLGGYYLRVYVLSRVSEILIYIAGIAGLVVTFWGDSLFGGGWELWFGYTTPNVSFTAAAVFVLFRYVLGISEERSRRQSMYRLGASALGIYLIHQIWALILAHFHITVFSFPAVAAVPLLTVILFVLSVPFAWLWGLLPWVKTGAL